MMNNIKSAGASFTAANQFSNSLQGQSLDAGQDGAQSIEQIPFQDDEPRFGKYGASGHEIERAQQNQSQYDEFRSSSGQPQIPSQQPQGPARTGETTYTRLSVEEFEVLLPDSPSDHVGEQQLQGGQTASGNRQHIQFDPRSQPAHQTYPYAPNNGGGPSQNGFK